MPFRRLVFATVVSVAACSPGFPSGDDITAAVQNAPKLKSVDITPLNASGIIGSLIISGWDRPSPELSAGIGFPNLAPDAAGARYPMHIHPGSVCNGVGIVVHDLGAPASSVAPGITYPTLVLPSVALPGAHLASGYYFDVHAPNDPTGPPLGCALF